MTEQEIKIAVAEACGWHKVQSAINIWAQPYHYNHLTRTVKALPDYPNDLNAMHEAEKTIPRHLWSYYVMETRRIIVRDCNTEPHYLPGPESERDTIADFWFYHATARQRAEAFLKTVGKWKEE